MLTGTPEFNAQMAKQNRDKQIVALLTLSHPTLLEPLNVVSDVKDITVDGTVFKAFPFGFQFPGSGDTIRRARITIQNVDKRIGQAAINIKGAMTGTLSAVLRDDPDQIIVEAPRLLLLDVRVNNAFVTGVLTGKLRADSAWPNGRATPERCPGLHMT